MGFWSSFSSFCIVATISTSDTNTNTSSFFFPLWLFNGITAAIILLSPLLSVLKPQIFLLPFPLESLLLYSQSSSVLKSIGCSSMSKSRKIEYIYVDKEEIEEDNFDEYEHHNCFDKEDLEEPYRHCTEECSEEIVHSIDRNSGRGLGNRLSGGPSPEKIRKCYDSQGLDRNLVMFSSGGLGRPQDADYSVLPQFSDELETVLFPRIPSELETMILARVGILEYKKLCSFGKRISDLVEGGDLLRERRASGIREALVFMLASGEENWWAFDHQFRTHVLPKWPADNVFKLGDKESLCAGTHLLVCGNGFYRPVIWTYEVMMDEWFEGPSMVEPRCLFASASSGDFAFVAGGIGLENNDVLSSGEKYNPEAKSWVSLPEMNEERKMCAGVYMDDKFYVVGGQDENGDVLTCAEVLDKEGEEWVKIDGMLDGLTTSYSPPLIAVVNNDLYLFETSSNCLMLYLKDQNSWKNLGSVPVRAGVNRGWGVAFKSLGNELLVIGGSSISISDCGMTIYTCYPDPKSENLNWKRRDGENSRSNFIRNCTVMLA